MNQYQFDRIFARMGKEFGKIPMGGEEEIYAYPSFALESNAMKVHREHPSSNSRRMREAIGLVLFGIQDAFSGAQTDISAFRNEDNRRLEHALQMAFDPQINPEIGAAFTDVYGSEGMTEEERRRYYEIIVRSLLRIKDSVDLWEKNLGSDGYFEFLEDYMGGMVEGTKMDFNIPVSAEKGMEKVGMSSAPKVSGRMRRGIRRGRRGL